MMKGLIAEAEANRAKALTKWFDELFNAGKVGFDEASGFLKAMNDDAVVGFARLENGHFIYERVNY